jgi:hypothetical protein
LMRALQFRKIAIFLRPSLASPADASRNVARQCETRTGE